MSKATIASSCFDKNHLLEIVYIEKIIFIFFSNNTIFQVLASCGLIWQAFKFIGCWLFEWLVWGFLVFLSHQDIKD